MACRPRPRKRVHAIRRRSVGSAFRKWDEFMKSCKDGNQMEVDDKKGFETREILPKENYEDHDMHDSES